MLSLRIISSFFLFFLFPVVHHHEQPIFFLLFSLIILLLITYQKKFKLRCFLQILSYIITIILAEGRMKRVNDEKLSLLIYISGIRKG